MTIRTTTIQAASMAQTTLGESANLVADFIRGKLNTDGGFSDRAGNSDLYYTVFAIETLLALQADFAKDTVLDYLGSIKLCDLDFVHLCCLARCLADMKALDDNIIGNITDQLADYRSADGGISNTKNSNCGTVYGCFLGTGVYQDMQIEIPGKDGIIDCLASLARDDGGYANEPSMTGGSTPSTAAAVTLQHFLGCDINPKSLDWLIERIHPSGGFVAMPSLPIADLLSTATALHALNLAKKTLTEQATEACLDFIDTLWSGNGAFCASAADQAEDCEYTYYGLMAIGHLNNQ